MQCSHESGDPEMSVQQIVGSRSVCEASDYARHEITNNDKITNADTETLDGDCSIENDSSVRVCDLAQSEEARAATVQVSRTSCLKVKTEARSKTRPDDDEDAEHDAHVGQGRGHGQHAGTDNGIDQVDDTTDPAGLAVDTIFLATRTARHAGGAVGARRRVAGRRANRGVTGHNGWYATGTEGAEPATRTSAATDHGTRERVCEAR